VLSNELLRFEGSGGEVLFNSEIKKRRRECIGSRYSVLLVDGSTPIVVSGGDVLADLRSLIFNTASSGGSNVIFITDPLTAADLKEARRKRDR
jgi:hypothetical protein